MHRFWCVLVFLPPEGDPGPFEFALVMLVVGRVPSAGGRSVAGGHRVPHSVLRGQQWAQASQFVPNHSPCVSGEAGSGVFPGVAVGMWQQPLPNLPLRVTLEMSFKSEKKACFAKQQIKIALPIQHIHSLCVLKIHLLTAITGIRSCVLWDGRGWAGVQLCHQPNHVELLVVPSPQIPWEQQGQSIGAEGHV